MTQKIKQQKSKSRKSKNWKKILPRILFIKKVFKNLKQKYNKKNQFEKYILKEGLFLLKDETDIFDEFEAILPDEEFPIFVITILNGFQSDTILDTLLDAIEKCKKGSG